MFLMFDYVFYEIAAILFVAAGIGVVTTGRASHIFFCHWILTRPHFGRESTHMLEE
jgi:hypothetical protein